MARFGAPLSSANRAKSAHLPCRNGTVDLFNRAKMAQFDFASGLFFNDLRATRFYIQGLGFSLIKKVFSLSPTVRKRDCRGKKKQKEHAKYSEPLRGEK
jgi:hypothetical protein